MKDAMNGVHGEVVLDFDDEEVDIFLIGLKEVDGVIAFTN